MGTQHRSSNTGRQRVDKYDQTVRPLITETLECHGSISGAEEEEEIEIKLSRCC